ncbi:hypothetical protein HPB47_002103 [Ixodes persulcatus]|uniref:Uncharacterized protein n=1 Tax=Ixodes persulcatus TaxID=34615 RepID=A0AC60PNC8_IXOPE|nr:hypothetical protein HPB47_002103 [Ixodes persulcatus]
MADSDEVKAILSSILVSEKNGLTLQALEAEYRSMNGAGIPFKSLGHATLQAYFESIPDAVALRRGPAGEWMAQVVCTSETAHVRRMVTEQKSGKPGPYRPPKNWDQKPRRNVAQPYRPLASRSARMPSNRPAVQRDWQRNVPVNRKGDQDGSASTFASWVMFLVSADVHPGLVRRYATLLGKQGLTPDNAWVMSVEDLFRVGVRNSHDIRLIQRHAHKVGAAMGMVDDDSSDDENVPPPKVLSQVRRASRGFKVTPMKRVSALRRLD